MNRRGSKSFVDFTFSRELNSREVKKPQLDDENFSFREVAAAAINREGTNYSVMSISFTKTSERCFDLAVADTDGYINLFDTRRNSSELRNIIGWQLPKPDVARPLLLFDVCMTKEDTQLLAAASDNTVKVWDIQNQNCVGLLRGHTWFVSSICPNPSNEDIIISGAMDGSLRLWDLRCKSNIVGDVRIPSKYVVDIAHHYHQGVQGAPVPMIITSVLWLKDPVRIATAGLNDSRIKIWDTRCLRQDVSDSCPPPIEQGIEHGISSLSQDDCGVLLCASGKNRRVHIHNTIQLDQRPVLSSEGGPTNYPFLKAAISPDAANIVYGATDQHAYVWQVNRLQEQPTVLNCDGGVAKVKWSNSEYGKFATAGGNTVRVWDKQRNE